MEVLVLIDFEGTMGDEITVRAGDIVKNVTKFSEEGWLEGELQGKRGIFPANFVKEVPIYLIGEDNREPRSLRRSKMAKQQRKCEVAYAYKPVNEDELELVVGETIEIIREIEDGWYMGLRGSKIGAFPSNFVKEIFVPKDGKVNESKTRPKLRDAMFSKDTKAPQKASFRRKSKNVTECCRAMFDYTALTNDELTLKKGDVISIINKEAEDEGWWEGELNGRRGFFPDNFVMLIPPTDVLQSESTSQPPVRQATLRRSVKAEASVMDKAGPAKTNEDKPDGKDLRSNPPGKLKLPVIITPVKPSPPPVKEKPNKASPKTNGDTGPLSPKHPEEKDQFDGLELSSEKLSHPTAVRAKPPQRRPPTNLSPSTALGVTEQPEPESQNKTKEDKLPSLPKVAENPTPAPSKPDAVVKSTTPARPAPPKVTVDPKAAVQKEEPSVSSLQAEIKELRMALDLMQTRHERDLEEMKEELRDERNKRTALQDEVRSLKMKH